MVSLQSAISNANSFKELAPIVKEAWEGITFWGFRYVSMCDYSDTEKIINHYPGKVHIDSLALRIFELIKANPQFDSTERKYGQAIAERISQIYSSSDGRFKNENLITRIFWHIRDGIYLMWTNSKGTKFLWQYGGRDEIFAYYTKGEYRDIFREEPDLNIDTEVEIDGVKRYARIERKGEQRVVVQHVNVANEGQARIGKTNGSEAFHPGGGPQT